MSPERWRRVDELFQSAAVLEGEARVAYLDRQCAGDASLRADLEALLAEDERSDRRIRGAIAFAAAEPAPPHIGPYRVLSVIGEGGMGTVYLACRDDQQFEKQVAIKVAGAGVRFAGETARVRFLLERQILASLDHPNIAGLLDGGVTETGLPYLVMEYVSGTPITVYCTDRQLPLRERLRLFLRVCSAVEYAHRRLVVHRDLKPSNILVGENGEPKLLDFGIAKLLDPAGAADAPPTAAGFFTPDYSSPEQMRGETVTVAADVYSLGLILFEMLTGRRARTVSRCTPDEIERAITEAETLRAGAGDLDNIVAMALRRETERRYSSVEQLAEDIRRYLDGRAVRAHKDTLRYRTMKFVKRNRWPVAAMAMVAAALVAGLIAATWQAQKARRRLVQVRHLANTFLFEVHDSLRALPGTTEVRAKLAQTSLEYLDSLLPDAGGDPTLTAELAAAYEKVGDVQGLSGTPNLGRTADALASYSKAVSLRRGLGASSVAALAMTLGKIGDLESLQGDKERALVTYRKAMQTAESTPANTREGLAIRTSILHRLGSTLMTMGRPFDSAECLRSAVQNSERMAALEPGQSAQRGLAMTKVRFGET
ncbi:MAG: serine/threonine-protein kinase, partial [Bryobacteraceae bacterium]